MSPVTLKRFGMILAAGLWGVGSNLAAREPVLKTEANVMVELTFHAAWLYEDPFNQVTLDVIFRDPAGHELRVPAFWAGTNVWKARYASPVEGTHVFRSECSEKQDRGLSGISGKLRITPYHGTNLLYVHGPLRVAEDCRHLEYADGAPFFWLGDTWWMGLCSRLRWPEDFQRLAADRKAKGFNVIQIVTGLYPDMHPFDPRGANETGFPWATNYTTIRPEYFDAADERLQYLVDQGFTPCLFGAWGHYIAAMGIRKTEQHWRYLIARYGAWPVVWCAAGEANLPWYGVKGFPYDDRQQAAQWSEVMRYIRQADPFHRLLTVHPTGIHRFSSRNVADDPDLLDIDILQTPHGRREAVAETIKTIRESYGENRVVPVINAEASYEWLEAAGRPIATEWTRRMFWLCMMNGAAGHTYGANGIWQVNRRGKPHGPSPTASSPPNGYGAIPWDEAMDLPGSSQVALGKMLFEQYPWAEFRPHREWASYLRKPSLNFAGCQWIWFPEGTPGKSAPAGKRFFRKNFLLPEGPIESAMLRVSADDRFTAWLNGECIGGSARGETDSWRTGKQFDDVTRWLRAGSNALSIEAENVVPAGAPEALNPAGLIARMEVRLAGREPLGLASDETWACAIQPVAGCDTAGFDDSAWARAVAVGRYCDEPWRELENLDNSDVFGPQSSGIPGRVRFIYVPENDAVRVRALEPGRGYRVTCFDPVTGVVASMGEARADARGQWLGVAPAGWDHDWVIIMEDKLGPGGVNRLDAKSGVSEAGLNVKPASSQ